MSELDDHPDAPSEAGIAAAFFCALYEDRAAGRFLSLAHYQERFRGFEALIEQEFAAFAAEEEEESGEDEPASSPAAEASQDGPKSLGRYRLVKSLGRGGQGEVWLAEDPRLKRRVALKILHAWSAASPQAFARFRREAEIASRLDHPGICTVYESGIEQGLPYFAMRFVEGESLAQRIAAQRERWAQESSHEKSSTPTSRAEVPVLLECFESAARAVHAAHEAGVIHRDLKPANIVVTASGQPVLLDFGLARDLESDAASLTHTGEVFGTPDYMAPEQVAGKIGDIDARTDVYALGVTLYECLTLRRPFTGATRDALYHAILHASPPRLRRTLPHVSRDLEVIVQTALEKEPARRYRSALELAEDLRRLRAGEPIRARRAGPLRRLSRWVRREPLTASLLGTVLVAVAVGGYLLARWLEVREELRDARVVENDRAIERSIEEGFLELGEDEEEDARVIFEDVLAQRRESPEAVIGLVLTYARDKDPKPARGVLERFGDLVERHSELAWAEAELLRQEGRAEEATRVEARITAAPSALTEFIRGFREIRKGHAGDGSAFGRAQEHLQQCVMTSEVARPLYHYQYAHAIGHGADLPLRRRTAEAILARWPDSGMAWYWAAFLSSDADYAETVRRYRKALEYRAHDERIWTNLGNAYRGLGDLDHAEECQRHALHVFPRYAHGWFNLGNLELARGRVEEAEACYRKLIEIDPHFRSAYFQLFTIAYKREDFGAAAEHIAHEVQNYPERDEAWGNWGQALRRANRFEEAQKVLDDALRLHPQSASCWRYLAFLRSDLKEREGAVQAYERAIELDPKDAVSLRQCGSVLLDLERFEEAREKLVDAVQVDAASAGAWALLSRAQMKLRRYDEALPSSRRSLELDPEHSQHRKNLAFLLQLMERPAENLAVLTAILEREPADYTRRCMRGQALMLTGRFDEALVELHAGGTAARKARNFSFAWEQWISDSESGAEQARADLALAREKGELPPSPLRLLALAELAFRERELSIALRAAEARIDGAERSRESLPFGFGVRAARIAQANGDPRALAWLERDLDELAQRGDVAHSLDLRGTARAWLEDAELRSLLDEPRGSAARARLEAWVRAD